MPEIIHVLQSGEKRLFGPSVIVYHIALPAIHPISLFYEVLPIPSSSDWMILANLLYLDEVHNCLLLPIKVKKNTVIKDGTTVCRLKPVHTNRCLELVEQTDLSDRSDVDWFQNDDPRNRDEPSQQNYPNSGDDEWRFYRSKHINPKNQSGNLIFFLLKFTFNIFWPFFF